MAIKFEDISAVVFKRVEKSDLSNFSIDNHMLSLLMAVDGQKSLSAISKKLHFTMDTIREVITRLIEMKLIEEAKPSISKLGRDFFDFLNIQLSLAIGPLSAILIEDAIHDLGQSMNNFPNYRAAELVDLISRDIQREDKRNVFKHKMLTKIKEL
ncbi:MAG: hypothetical protein V2B19_28970 [Pseudomonadota bacterium]